MPLRVLLVEDEVAVLKVLEGSLASMGLEVRSLSDSREAVALIGQEKFDAIFLDLMMPEVNGFELTRLVRNSSWNRTTPIFIITGREDKEAMEEVFAAGGTFLLHKPLDKNKLARLFQIAHGTMLEGRLRLRRVEIETEVICEAGSRRIRGTSLNLSQDGIFFRAEDPPQQGSQVRVFFHLPEQRIMIEAAGVVSRVDEQQRVAVQFTRMDVKDRARIRELVASQMDNV